MKEHRQLAFGHLPERRSLAERPAVLQVAQPTGRVEQREGGQRELLPELLAELVPDARITAVLHETLHIGPLRLARDHHRRRGPPIEIPCTTIRVRPPKKPVGDIHPPQHVETVLPPHADGSPLALAVVMEIGQQDIAAQVVIVKVADHQHPHGVVRVAVDDDRRPVGRFGRRGVNGMEPLAPRRRRSPCRAASPNCGGCRPIPPETDIRHTYIHRRRHSSRPSPRRDAGHRKACRNCHPQGGRRPRPARRARSRYSFSDSFSYVRVRISPTAARPPPRHKTSPVRPRRRPDSRRNAKSLPFRRSLPGAERPLRPVPGDHGQLAPQHHPRIDDRMEMLLQPRMRRNQDAQKRHEAVPPGRRATAPRSSSTTMRRCAPPSVPFRPTRPRLFRQLGADMRQHVVGHARKVPLGFPPHSSRAQVSSSELGQLSAISRFTGSMS